MPYADPEKRREYHRAHKREWRKRNPQAEPNNDRVKNANRRAVLYGAEGRITLADVRSVLPEGATCVYCGGTYLLGIDHRVALSEGGANERSNLQPCCRSCNASKFRGDVPRRWSRSHDACVDCGSTDRKHRVHGLCERCYSRNQSRARRRTR